MTEIAGEMFWFPTILASFSRTRLELQQSFLIRIVQNLKMSHVSPSRQLFQLPSVATLGWQCDKSNIRM
jgi:hypothetical protein